MLLLGREGRKVNDILTEKGKAIILNTIGDCLLTNCYLSYHEVMEKIAKHDIYCFCYEEIVILIHPMNGIHKMYYFLEDLEILNSDLVRKIRDDLQNYPNLEGTVVSKMPNRNVDILEKLQFYPYKVYIRKQMLAGANDWCAPMYPIEIADTRDLHDIYELFYTTFDIMTDHLVSVEELRIFLELSQVIKISIEGKMAGVLLFESMGKKSYLRLICVSDEFIGKKVGLSLLQGYIFRNQKETKLFYLWVESTNERAIHLYEKFGYRDDGLREYTYLYLR